MRLKLAHDIYPGIWLQPGLISSGGGRHVCAVAVESSLQACALFSVPTFQISRLRALHVINKLPTFHRRALSPDVSSLGCSRPARKSPPSAFSRGRQPARRSLFCSSLPSSLQTTTHPPSLSRQRGPKEALRSTKRNRKRKTPHRRKRDARAQLPNMAINTSSSALNLNLPSSGPSVA